MTKTLVRAFIRAAVIKAKNTNSTAKDILEAIIVGRFESEITNGKTVVSSTIGDQTVSFHIPSDMGPANIIELAEIALEELEGQEDQDNPNLTPRRLKKLKVRFV